MHGEPLLPLAERYANLYQQLQDGSDTEEELAAVFKEFKVAKSEFRDACEELVKIDRNILGKIAELDELLARLGDMKGRWTNRRKRLHDFLLLLMQRTNEKKVQTQTGTVSRSLRNEPVVDDEALLPEDYLDYKVTVKKPALREALLTAAEKHEQIPGAHLEVREGLSIR